MMDLINLLPDTIFLMATIFAGMGRGNSNDTERLSGRLTFKKLVEGAGICFTEDARGITISSTSTGTGNISIDSLEIAHGTGTGLTSSNFCVSQTTWRCGVFGFGSIRSATSSSNRSCVLGSCNSFIIGGSYNCTILGRNSVILGGLDNKINSCGNSVIVGGASNRIYATSSSIIASEEGLVNSDSHHSSIISGCISGTRLMPYSVIISSLCDYGHGNDQSTGKSSKMFTSISTCCTRHNFVDGIGSKNLNCAEFVTHNGVISGICNSFCFPLSSSVIAQGTIISSDNSFICAYLNPKYSTPECSRSATIISSYQSKNSGYFSTVISSRNVSNKVYTDTSLKSGFTTIISSFGSRINQTRSSSLISTIYSYSPNDFRITNSTAIGTQYSDAKGSRSSIISGYASSVSSLNSSIIASKYSSSNYRSSVIVGSSKALSYIIDNGNIQGFEGSLINLEVGGSTNCFHFTVLGSYKSCGFGNSIVIGGHTSRAGLTMQSGLNKTYHCETRYGDQRSIMIGGFNNCSSASNGALVIGGKYNCELNTVNSSIISGYKNCIYANGCYAKQCTLISQPPYYTSSILNTVENNFIIGGCGNYFTGKSNRYMTGFNKYGPSYIKNSGIIGSFKSKICGTTNTYYFRPAYGFNCPGLTSSVILGGDSLINCRSYSLMVSNLTIKGAVKTCKGPTLATLCTGVSGTFTSPSFIQVVNGLVTSVT